MARGMSVPTLVAVPRQEVAREPEEERAEEEQHAAHPGQLPRLPVGLEEPDADQVDEDEGDHEGRRPGMDRAHDPAQGDVGHDPGDARVRLLESRPVVEGQDDAGHDLDEEENQDGAAGVHPDRVAAPGDGLVPHEAQHGLKAQPLVEPAAEGGPTAPGAHAGGSFLMTISAPSTLTLSRRSGEGGGPAMLRPSSSYQPSWQAQKNFFSAAR